MRLTDRCGLGSGNCRRCREPGREVAGDTRPYRGRWLFPAARDNAGLCTRETGRERRIAGICPTPCRILSRMLLEELRMSGRSDRRPGPPRQCSCGIGMVLWCHGSLAIGVGAGRGGRAHLSLQCPCFPNAIVGRNEPCARSTTMHLAGPRRCTCRQVSACRRCRSTAKAMWRATPCAEAWRSPRHAAMCCNQVGLLGMLSMFDVRDGDFKTSLHYAQLSRVVAGTIENSAAMALANSNLGRALQFVGEHRASRLELEASFGTGHARREPARCISAWTTTSSSASVSHGISGCKAIRFRPRNACARPSRMPNASTIRHRLGLLCPGRQEYFFGPAISKAPRSMRTGCSLMPKSMPCDRICAVARGYRERWPSIAVIARTGVEDLRELPRATRRDALQDAQYRVQALPWFTASWRSACLTTR